MTKFAIWCNDDDGTALEAWCAKHDAIWNIDHSWYDHIDVDDEEQYRRYTSLDENYHVTLTDDDTAVLFKLSFPEATII